MSADDELAERGRAIFERLRDDTDMNAADAPLAPAESDPAAPEPAVQPTLDAAPDSPVAASPEESGEADPVDAADTPPEPATDPAQDSVSSGPVQAAESDPVSQPAATVGQAGHPGPAPAETTGIEPVPAADEGGGSGTTTTPATEDLDAAESAPLPPVEAATVAELAPKPAVETETAGVKAPETPAVELPGGDDVAIALDDPPAEPVANPFARPLPRVLAIANQKGGVGKTTTAVNLGAALAELGYRVLVIDLDPQGNATTGLGVNPRNLETSVYDVIMHDIPLEDCIEPTSLRNLFVVPATIDLAGAEIELVPAFSRELKLRKALEPVLEDFDFALIDCPPSLGLITVNGLAAATEVVVPIQCEYYALEGLGQLLRNVNLVQGNLNPRLEVSAIILTMYDARTKLADQVASEVRAHFGSKVCRNIVPRTVRLSEAPSFGQPIIVFDPSSRGAIAYRELAKEVSGGAPQRVG